MTTQVRNAAMVNLLRSDFQARYEPQFALAQVMSNMMALPGLRGFWPMSAVDASGNAFDQSANVRTLTYNGNPTYNYDDLAPYIDLDGTGDYLSRADEAGLDILGTETYVANPGLTMGGWFYDTASSGTRGLMGKYVLGGSRSYLLFHTASGGNNVVNFNINAGAGDTTLASSDTFAANQWIFVASRYTPSAEIKLWVNANTYTNTTSIPAALNNSTANFDIGALSGGTNLLAGRASLCFLCASALSDAIISNLFQQSRALFGV